MIIKPENSEELVHFLKSKPLILYGMGDTGTRISKWCDEQGVDYLFSDRNALELQNVTSKKVILPQSIISEYTDANIVVSSIAYNQEIVEDLLRLGVQKERIYPSSLFIPGVETWKEMEDNDFADWEIMRKRFEMIAQWNIPHGGGVLCNVKTVADYGAGRKYIEQYLPASVEYYPIDYIDRGDGTIICDFNKREFPDIFTDLSVCVGVLMYIQPAVELIAHICEHTGHTIIFSYVTLEGFPDIDNRRRSCMYNAYTEQQIVDMFFSYKFELKDRRHDTAGNSTMLFFLFQRRHDG